MRARRTAGRWRPLAGDAANEAPYVLSVRFLDGYYRCADCRASYSHKVFSVLSSQRMKKDERIAMNRLYFRRYFG